MWTTASCWESTTSHRFPTRLRPRRRSSITFLCYSSACGRLQIHRRNRAAAVPSPTDDLPARRGSNSNRLIRQNMIMTTTFFQRPSSLRLGCAAALLLMLCATPSLAQTVAVMVNGEPITDYDIEQRSKLNFLSTHKPQVRKQVIDELIDEKLKIKEAKKYSIDPSSSDIDGLYSGMSSRMHITPDQLTKSLASSGIRPETLKERMRAEMVWSSLVRGRFKESLQVGEKEVVAAAKSDETPEKADA